MLRTDKLVFLPKYDGDITINVNFGTGIGVALSKTQITERVSKGGFSDTLHSFYTPESIERFLTVEEATKEKAKPDNKKQSESKEVSK